MSRTRGLSCREIRRRGDVRAASLFGLDFADIGNDSTQRTLEVFFLGKAPEKIQPANICIEGGQSIRDVRATAVRLQRNSDATLDDSMEVTLNKYGDFSIYTLRLVQLDEKGQPTGKLLDGFDPHYSSVRFSFKAGCPTDLDCKTSHVCPPPVRVQPEINYLAKDYASFRQLILDRLALTMPAWQESHVPDLGISLVELLAYVGDYLSYYQDAVATEAYLGTARQRISVRRHARFVDYRMHEGSNARAWITINAATDDKVDPQSFYFITGFPGSPDPGILQPADIKNAPAGSFEIFEPLVKDPTQEMEIFAAHSEICFYTWGNCQCCLGKGATSATLVDQWMTPPGSTGGGGDQNPNPAGTPTGSTSNPGPAPEGPSIRRKAAPASATAIVPANSTVGPTPGTLPPSRLALVAPKSTAAPPASSQPTSDGPSGTVRALQLQVGDVLILEEVLGPHTGNPADADPAHRQAVRLTKVTQSVDPLYHPYGEDFGQPLVEIEWCSEDALKFPLCISWQKPLPDCGCLENVSVARGNVILVDHGAKTTETLGTVCVQSTQEKCPTKCSPAETSVLPAKFRTSLKNTPLTFAEPLPPCGCASAIFTTDPRQALPQITLSSTLVMPQGTIALAWNAKQDLLESGPIDTDFVVEMDNDGDAHLRFGDGSLGMIPDAGTTFQAAYRVGNGTEGNVGAETIVYLVFRETDIGHPKLTPRNPLAAAGGTAPEPMAEVKMFAPFAFRSTLERAVTADDYAALAADNARRLEERIDLVIEATSQPAAPVSNLSVDDQRKQEEEEPREPAKLGPDICTKPFHPLQAAKSVLRWTGSWYEALIAIDPENSETADSELLLEVDSYLEPYRRIGHDLEVKLADYVPLDLALTICVLPDFQRAHVESALLAVFSTRIMPDGNLGFFHPDNLTFGQGIYASRIIAAAQGISGVQEVQLTRLKAFRIGEAPQAPDDPTTEVPPHGVFSLGPFQIARLDNNPSVPEDGRLTLNLRGGR